MRCRGQVTPGTRTSILESGCSCHSGFPLRHTLGGCGWWLKFSVTATNMGDCGSSGPWPRPGPALTCRHLGNDSRWKTSTHLSAFQAA